MSPAETYKSLIDQGEFEPDPGQHAAVDALDRVYRQVRDRPAPKKSLFGRWFGDGNAAVNGITGLYLWGGVGRGKTWLMDLFYDALPGNRKRRVHFHRYMRSIHEDLRNLSDQEDPLAVIAAQQASEFDVLCFDEFVVEDIGDAMILAGLLKTLFDRGVTLVATSNTAPDDLYRNGLQRDRFKPAIELIKQHCDVMLMSDGLDFRLRTLDRDATYLVPADAESETRLTNAFDAVASGVVHDAGVIQILGRDIRFRRRAEGVVWFDFEELCGGLRSSADYIEIARENHTIFLSAIPVMNAERDDEARRFIEMIDEFYDRSINLIVSANAEPQSIYVGKRLEKPFERTTSRLIEMQSREYLAREKRAS